MHVIGLLIKRFGWDGGNREIMNNDIMNVRLGKWSFWWTSDTSTAVLQLLQLVELRPV